MSTKFGIEKWREWDGDNTLALDWDLNENSHVWEIGGFEGRWAQQIWDKFHCNITVFEPQVWAVNKMILRFQEMDKIKIRPYGLWTEDAYLAIGDFYTDGASVLKDKFPQTPCLFKDIFWEISNTPNQIDLALMNIEGAEYKLIPELVKRDAISRFKNFWCQFHPGLVGIGEDAVDYKVIDIFLELDETHDILWDFYPTAVAWKRR